MRELLHKSLLGMVLILIPFSVAAASQKVSGSVVLGETQCVSVGVNDAKLTIYRHNADRTTSLANDIYRDAALQVCVTQQGLDFVAMQPAHPAERRGVICLLLGGDRESSTKALSGEPTFAWPRCKKFTSGRRTW